MTSLFLRKKGRGLGVLGLMLGAWFSWGAEASAKPIQQQGLRLELRGLAELGFNAEHGPVGGLGMSLGYSVVSLGVEGQFRQLAARDQRYGEYAREIVAVGVPLLLSLQGDIPSTPLRVGAAAGVGWFTGPKVQTSACTYSRYDSRMLVGRVFLQYIWGRGAIGPHVGYSHHTGALTVRDGCFVLLPEGDPSIREYPNELSSSFQVGIQGTLNIEL